MVDSHVEDTSQMLRDITTPFCERKFRKDDQVISSFARGMEIPLQQAGAVARMLQGRVGNDGKSDLTALPNDDEALRQRRAAKTLADEVVQEILLVAASTLLDKSVVTLDAEEKTPSTAGFATFDRDRSESLIIDPIDGTLQYLNGEDNYSLCVGLVRNGIMASALVYFAAQDVCYVLDETGQSFVTNDFSEYGWRNIQELHTIGHQGRRVYANGRVEAQILARLRKQGYDVIDDTELSGGAPECIAACLTGEALGYIAHTRQIRDVLMGAIVGGAHGGSALTWNAESLRWPPRGRVERALFLGGDIPDDFIPCLIDELEHPDHYTPTGRRVLNK